MAGVVRSTGIADYHALGFYIVASANKTLAVTSSVEVSVSKTCSRDKCLVLDRNAHMLTHSTCRAAQYPTRSRRLLARVGCVGTTCAIA